MYGGKSRKNKRINKRKSKKNRKSRKIRKYNEPLIRSHIYFLVCIKNK
jgi:hypothetical protein